MKSIYLQVLIWLFCVQGYGGNKSFKVIWAIGKADNSVAEFALFPSGDLILEMGETPNKLCALINVNN